MKPLRIVNHNRYMNITPQDAMDEYKRYENTMKQLNAARTPKSKMHSSRGTGYVMAV